MIKYMRIARKIHRIFVLIITAISLIMMATGSLLKYPFLAKNIGIVDLGLVRYIHNNLSPFLSIVLIVMVVTGCIMYFFPMIIRLEKK